MGDKSAIEKTFDFLKAKGILTKYRTFEDFEKK